MVIVVLDLRNKQIKLMLKSFCRYLKKKKKEGERNKNISLELRTKGFLMDWYLFKTKKLCQMAFHKEEVIAGKFHRDKNQDSIFST